MARTPGLTNAQTWIRNWQAGHKDKTHLDAKAAWVAEVQRRKETKKKEIEAAKRKKEFDRQQRVKEEAERKAASKAQQALKQRQIKEKKQRIKRQIQNEDQASSNYRRKYKASIRT